MKSNQNQSDAFLLHATKFKESSLLCVFFSKDFGKVSAVAKGARSKKSKFQVLTVPGAIFKISFSGKNDLKTLLFEQARGKKCRPLGRRKKLG